MSSKKTKNRKKAAISLTKFLKSRKTLGVSLGICLAVLASAYIAMAKFSADSTTTTTTYVEPALTGINKTLVVKGALSNSTKDIRLEGKQCHGADNTGAIKLIGGCNAVAVTFKEISNLNGEYVLRFNVVNFPSISKSGKKTDQFYLAPEGDNTLLIKKIVVTGKTAKTNWASVSIPYPLAKTQAKAQSFLVNGGRQIKIKDATTTTGKNSAISTSKETSETAASSTTAENKLKNATVTPMKKSGSFWYDLMVDLGLRK